MARLWLLSDLHDDQNAPTLGRPFRLPQGIEADALILAGDICGRLSRSGLRFIEALKTDLPIVIIAGNHDFWTGSLDAEIGRFRGRCRRPNTHILDGEAIEIAGTRIAGATLWTDYAIRHPDGQWTAMNIASRQHGGMTDFHYIRDRAYSRRLTPDRLLEEHERQLAALDAILSTTFDGPTAIITHHAPSARSLQHGRATEDLDGSYASNLDDFILRHRPELWIHGHVHRRKDYWIGDTHIVANPRGYATRPTGRPRLEFEATDWDPRLIIGTGVDRLLHGLSGATIEHAIDRPGAFAGPMPLATTEGLDADLAFEVEARRSGGNG
ncbi:metallophosphoesterase [Aureimonas psammosilenae]|uniref:metallophosphoesterase n=1 Tax=Aureimonas psammosilenae TaxID=2495496 RepID=UPI001260BA64|nr:metallophosphoesterase [Aureimonas psammosilenae]